MNIIVHDQFDKPLSKVWDGAPVTESGKQIGLPGPTEIKSSAYVDPAGVGCIRDAYPLNDPEVAAWPTSSIRMVGPYKVQEGKVDVEVDGISLQVAVVGRYHEYVPPDTINIIWP